MTGASSGIGKAIAIALGRAGVKVSLSARRLDKLESVKNTINQGGGTAICVKTDVTNRAEVKEMVRQTEEKLGPVDILVNNAGLWYWTLMKNVREDLWDEIIDVNIKGFTNCIGAVLDGMTKRRTGHIVCMSSENGKKGFKGLAVYTASKFYVEGLAQTLRQEVCEYGIRVTNIQPGDVVVEDRKKTYRDEEAIPLDTSASGCKLLDPSDIANAVMYALTQPDTVAVNEVLVQCRDMPL